MDHWRVPPLTPPPSFYEPPPDVLAGPPGSVIDRLELHAPPGLRGWAVLYRSTGISGEPIAVSGLVLAASGGPPPRLIAWAHGTTGIADACAPSREGLPSLAGLAALPGLGYAIAATDYEGLGTAGLHPYMVGPSEGRSVLDSLRAAAAVLDIPPTAPAAIVGISQGGHAALWAGESQAGYADELDIAGVVAASPPIDLRAVQAAVLDREATDAIAWMESLLVVAAWHDVLGAPVDGMLTNEGRHILDRLARECPWQVQAPTETPFLVDPKSVPEWQRLLEANSPGHARSRAAILVLAARGDEVIDPSTIEPGVERLRAAGSDVHLRWINGGHDATVTSPEAQVTILGWLTERFRR
jgi:alpha-beta hydrolase superfamily lysophospholipase